MLHTPAATETGPPEDPLLDLLTFATELEAWLDRRQASVTGAARPEPTYEKRVAAMRELMADLFAAGWSRYGWPEAAGGRGGTILHRGALWDALARHGVGGMALFEHLEILAPALVALGPPPLVADLLPRFLAGEQLWAQGFSEPGAGSDLASLRTSARAVEGGWRVNGRKIWTSWARYATWCLLLARTGTPESRHRGVTALVVDLRDAGVHVRPIMQANGTDELAEVAFDDVFVPTDRLVGELDGGWKVAMHILSYERGTFAWFRHLFLYGVVRDAAVLADGADDVALGNALLDLTAVTGAGYGGLLAHTTGHPMGPAAAHAKLLLCEAEQSVADWLLATDPDLAIDPADDEAVMRRQEYLFSRIVTVYGGSQQMQLETIAKQLLGLP